MKGLTLSAGNKKMVTYKCAKILLTRGFIGEFSSSLMHKILTTEKVRAHKYMNYVLHFADFLKTGM